MRKTFHSLFGTEDFLKFYLNKTKGKGFCIVCCCIISFVNRNSSPHSSPCSLQFQHPIQSIKYVYGSQRAMHYSVSFSNYVVFNEDQGFAQNLIQELLKTASLNLLFIFHGRESLYDSHCYIALFVSTCKANGMVSKLCKVVFLLEMMPICYQNIC